MAYIVKVLVIETDSVIASNTYTDSNSKVQDFAREVINNLNLYAIELRIWDKDNTSITVRGTFKDLDFSTVRIGNYVYNPDIRFVGELQNNNKSTMTPIFNFINKYGTSSYKGRISKIFAGTNVTNLDLSGWDVSKLLFIEALFDGCTELKSVNVSTWDTSSVCSFKFLFRNCYNLEIIDVGDWDVSNLKCAAGMFENCSSIVSLNVSNWNTSKLSNARSMFKNCESLTTLDISQWDTIKLKDATSMFEYCERLPILDVSQWCTTNLILATRMFHYCHSLKTIDVSQWITEELENISHMFEDCENVKTIDISRWLTTNIVKAKCAISPWCVDKQTSDNFDRLYNSLYETRIQVIPEFQEINIEKPQSLDN